MEFLGWAIALIKSLGYGAIFVVGFVGTSTLFIPFPVDSVISFVIPGIGLHPFVVGISAGLGSATGELVGYAVGFGSRKLIKEKEEIVPWIKTVWKRRKWYAFMDFVAELFQKYGFPVIIFTAAIPFPFDFIGILAGLSGYQIKKFFIGTSFGKCIKTLIIAYLGWALLV